MCDIQVKDIRVRGSGHCHACDKPLADEEARIRGIHSGEELGLCRECSNIVNTIANTKSERDLFFEIYHGEQR